MLGPFSLGDSLRVYRLQRRGLSLDLESDLTQPHSPLWEAWLALLTQQAMGQPAYVLDDSFGVEAFVQVRYRLHQAAADVTYMSPALAEKGRTGRAWSLLLDGACADVAGRGIQRVFAHLPESGAERDVFHQAGFALYAAEDIYRLAHQPVRGDAPLRYAQGALNMRPQRLEDWLALQKLCVAITPQRVRQAEGGIEVALASGRPCQNFVLPGESGDDLAAAVTICPGGLATWLRVLVHPDASISVEDIILWSLATLGSGSARPVYCRVRRYEGGIRVPLEASGFELFAARVLMVKHTAAWIKTPVQELVPALKGGAEPVPPAYRINE